MPRDVVNQHERRQGVASIVEVGDQRYLKGSLASVGKAILALVADGLARQRALDVRLDSGESIRPNNIRHGLANDGKLVKPKTVRVRPVGKMTPEIVADEISNQRRNIVRQQSQ